MVSDLANVHRVIDEMLAVIQGALDTGKDRTGLPACGDTRSLTGGQLQALELGLVSDECEWGRLSRAELRMNRRALMILLWKRLTPDERLVCWVRNSPIGCAVYRQSIHSWELRPDDDYKRRDPHYSDKVVVERKKPTYPDLMQTAEILHMSTRQVRSRTQGYMAKIEDSEEFRLLRAR